MPAAAVKGIIVSLSIITALGLAVIENPQIQAWLEEQRQRIAELLRSIGQELDPESRRAAEAFAFEGRTPVNDAGLRREMSGSQDAAAVATGRSMSSTGSIRRIPIKGPSDPDEAAERRRKGREYLARRNQEMYEMQQKRKGEAKENGIETPPSPTSFDAMVDDEGKLRLVDNEVTSLPDPPTSVPIPEKLQAEMAEVERNLKQPIQIAESSSSASAWQAGSTFANPFDDENAMEIDRSVTPKPPVPPKIALEELPPQPVVDSESEIERPQTPRMPGSFTPRPEPTLWQRAQAAAESARPDMSYEEQEQLAIALSLSEAERRASEDAERRRSQADEEDAELRAAILASLREQQASAASASAPVQPAPLIDITEPPPAPPVQPSPRRGQWETLFDQDYSPAHEPLSSVSHSVATSEEEDELYSVTPQLTRARLASLDAQTPASPTPYDPVREAAASHLHPANMMDESFYSAASPARSQTLEAEAQPVPQLVDTTVPPPTTQPQTPSTHPAFSTDSDSIASSDTFASLSAPPSRDEISVAAPSTRHEDSDADVEVVDITHGDDSDVDMLSEVEGEGIRTPDSWTEVGSWDGESEVSEDDAARSGDRKVVGA